MSVLPVAPLARATVTIAGQDVEYHALSRAQAVKVQHYKGREDEAEAYIVACGLDIPVEEAAEWLGTVDVATGGPLVDGILILSGLAKKQVGKNSPQ